jgi:hypothetical protein
MRGGFTASAEPPSRYCSDSDSHREAEHSVYLRREISTLGSYSVLAARSRVMDLFSSAPAIDSDCPLCAGAFETNNFSGL